MRKLLFVVAFVALAAPEAFAEDTQDKAQSCNDAAQNQRLQGQQRASFVRKCTSASAKGDSAQSCNDKAKNLQGEQRANFLRRCTSASSEHQKVQSCRDVANDKSLSADQRRNLMSKCRQ